MHAWHGSSPSGTDHVEPDTHGAGIGSSPSSSGGSVSSFGGGGGGGAGSEEPGGKGAGPQTVVLLHVQAHCTASLVAHARHVSQGVFPMGDHVEPSTQ